LVLESADVAHRVDAQRDSQPDGKPDMSGQWLLPIHPGYLGNIAADLEPTDVQP
jgi:hypothetical protein